MWHQRSNLDDYLRKLSDKRTGSKKAIFFVAFLLPVFIYFNDISEGSPLR